MTNNSIIELILRLFWFSVKSYLCPRAFKIDQGRNTRVLDVAVDKYSEILHPRLRGLQNKRGSVIWNFLSKEFMNI
jgi:hypothetical protein